MSHTGEIIALTEKWSARNYQPLPVVISRGEGAWVWDVEGNRYLDCLSAYSALNQGHRHPRILQALLEQAAKITVTSRAFHNETMGAMLAKLCGLCEMEMALPMNTGAEAVETAVKAARKWGYQIKGVPADQAEIIVCRDNFHGRTTTIVSFSSESQYREGFGPFTPGFKLVDFGDIGQLERAITPNTVGFLVEPIQGEAGILIPPEGYLSKARELCSKNRVLLMLDEIQTGLGRTGRLFAYQHEKNAKPDLLIIGKALGGGVYPVSAVVGSREVLGVFRPGDHGSTFGGNPLGAAVAMAALDVIIDEELSRKSAESGRTLMEMLSAIPSKHVHEIRGRGLMIAVEIAKSSGPARPFCERLMKLGVLAKETHHQTIRLAPPLSVGRVELDLIANAFREALR
ncbi:MAG: ornithine--oxo-acid transaminase [Oligoflexia bacterium]|nr:ornithine--oxo-acid transaminase [Oligoflexia bacterium]